MRTIDRLAVAKRAHELTLSLYALTRAFPKNEQYGLVSQLRRAAVAIGSNISEGDAGNSNAEFARYLDIAKASTGEVAYQLLVAHDLGYLEEPEYRALSEEVEGVRAMLVSLIRSVGSRPRSKTHTGA